MLAAGPGVAGSSVPGDLGGQDGHVPVDVRLPDVPGCESTLSYAPGLAWLAWLFAVPGIGYSWFSALGQYFPSGREAAIGRIFLSNVRLLGFGRAGQQVVSGPC